MQITTGRPLPESLEGDMGEGFIPTEERPFRGFGPRSTGSRYPFYEMLIGDCVFLPRETDEEKREAALARATAHKLSNWWKSVRDAYSTRSAEDFARFVEGEIREYGRTRPFFKIEYHVKEAGKVGLRIWRFPNPYMPDGMDEIDPAWMGEDEE